MTIVTASPRIRSRSARSTLLLPRIARGDGAALAVCMALYEDLVTQAMRGYRSVMSEPEDLLQDVFLEIWRCANRYDPSISSEAAFIRSIARRRVIDRMRRDGRRGQPGDLDDGLPCMDPGLERVEAMDDVHRVQRALESLSHSEREAVEMHSQGFSMLDMAKTRNEPVETVKSRLRRTLQKVRWALSHGPSLGGWDHVRAPWEPGSRPGA